MQPTLSVGAIVLLGGMVSLSASVKPVPICRARLMVRRWALLSLRVLPRDIVYVICTNHIY